MEGSGFTLARISAEDVRWKMPPHSKEYSGSRNFGSTPMACSRLKLPTSVIFEIGMSAFTVRWILAMPFIAFKRASNRSRSAGVTRSHLLSRITSAKAICSFASSASSMCSQICLASTRVTTALMTSCSFMSSSTKKVCTTGPGSARPVVSMRMWSNLSRRFMRLPTMRMRSPRTVQQMQPLFISKISSSALMTSSWSIPISPNSFSITAMRWPCCSVSRRFMRVVLPAPRKPVRTVTGVRVVMGRYVLDLALSGEIGLLRKARPSESGSAGED